MTLIQFVSYAKKFCVAVVAALGILAVALEDGVITAAEWVQVLIAFSGAAGVYGLSNTPKKELK